MDTKGKPVATLAFIFSSKNTAAILADLSICLSEIKYKEYVVSDRKIEKKKKR